MHVSGNRFPPLPTDHHTKQIWLELSKGFDEYHVVARATNMRFSHTVEGNLHLHLIPSFGKRMWVFFFLSWMLPYFLFRYAATHVVAQCPVVGGTAAAAAARIFDIPLLVELHGSHYFMPSRPGRVAKLEHLVYRLFSSFTFAAARQIRCLSDDMRNNLCKVYGTHLSEKAIIIPTRVDLSIFTETKADYKVAEVLRVVSVGSFVPLKNHLELITHLAQSGVPFHLTLVGNGPLKQEYVQLASDLGVISQVTLAGQLSHAELAKLLVSQDIYVHYSLSEGLSRAILEAMAAALPVVATNVGFIGGILLHTVNSLVLDAPTSECLGAAIRQVYSSADIRCILGRAGRRMVEERFAASQVFADYRRAILGLVAA
jgi:glycosyltransferase involved in cell wall biosynthesis